jgi:hypothetical protein
MQLTICNLCVLLLAQSVSSLQRSRSSVYWGTADTFSGLSALLLLTHNRPRLHAHFAAQQSMQTVLVVNGILLASEGGDEVIE